MYRLLKVHKRSVRTHYRHHSSQYNTPTDTAKRLKVCHSYRLQSTDTVVYHYWLQLSHITHSVLCADQYSTRPTLQHLKQQTVMMRALQKMALQLKTGTKWLKLELAGASLLQRLPTVNHHVIHVLEQIVRFCSAFVCYLLIKCRSRVTLIVSQQWLCC
jgi:hypothetical protein